MTGKATSGDVAKLAGVSQSAVSSILNNNDKISFSEETRAKVISAAQTLGYMLPKHKKNGGGNGARPGVILTLVPTLSNQYYAELGRALENYADSVGIRVIVCSTFRKSELEKYYLELFRKTGIGGVVYTFLPSYPQMARQIDAVTPVVLIGEKEEGLAICSFELNNIKSAAMLGEHLYQMGHRRFAFISTPFKGASLARGQRLEGLLSMLRNHALPKEALLVMSPSDYFGGGEADRSFQPYEYIVGKKMTDNTLKKDAGVTAFIAVNDMTALGVVDALKERGYRIPKDYSVCGFDNIFSASVTDPALTTVDHKLSVRCKAAIDMILERLENGGAPSESHVNKIEYVPQLIIRGSTGPAPER